MPISIHELYFTDIEAKIALAHHLYQQYGPSLATEDEVAAHLAAIASRSAELNRQMQAMDMGRLCSACAAKPGGGCCSSYMANEADAVLLLINLLAGRPVERQREDDVECLFLGPQGCTLEPKPMFCLNYNCRAILDMEPAQVTELITVAGAVLRAQTALEQYLLERIRHGR